MPETSSGDAPSILIIGTGFGGLGMAITLKKAGFHNFQILEKASDIGGTWRDNTYPGAACDIQSHLYSYSFEPKHDWSRKFGLQAEILDYLRHCVRKYDLAGHLKFDSEISEAKFDGQSSQWIIQLKNGGSLSADVLISATGQLNLPALPNIPGMDHFSGEQFHSARWNHECNLADKRVAVIGTGASAIQFVPEIAGKVKSLVLFQRSAPWVLRKPDRPFRHWEQALFKVLPPWDRLYRWLIYWKNESRALAFTRFNRLLDIYAWQGKREARKQVTDPEKFKHVIPDYQIGCKRVLISNDWYRALNRPNVTLVTEDIDHMDQYAVVTKDGAHYPVDVIIYGTGFRASEFLSPISIIGKNGRSLDETWANGASAFKGITVNGFPNFFMLYGPNTNLAHNSIIYMLESQFSYVLDAVKLLAKDPGMVMEVAGDRQNQYVSEIQSGLEGSVWSSGCHSWYLDASGKNTVNWPGFTFTYRWSTRRVDPDNYSFYRFPNRN
ncbi:flavin-containing monooxygenase [Marinobacter sp. F4216]|uniref:flavin-containing monooxygenase n=1 Tax=Marinobacter sp. F4216 TaxID=2874281 RepID=UPI001CBF60EB|nr:NAD(P)/FAD-dependent oxidoreductase [Marinobacter sp. F4216]MBZ2168162.1 NAD(P)/FAD-dependent oxidoreductase [Marinobacter sp. F4216]